LRVATMALVILAYDQLMFRPIVAWADKFRFEQTAAQQRPQSWVYDLVRRGRLIHRLFAPFEWTAAWQRRRRPSERRRGWRMPPALARASDAVWIALVLVVGVYAIWLVVDYARATLGLNDV